MVYDGKRMGRSEIPRDELLGELYRLSEELGRAPTIQEMDESGAYSSGTYRNRFGSWNLTLKEAGIDKREKYQQPTYCRISDVDLLFDLSTGRQVLGDWPTSQQYRTFGEHSTGTIQKRFGSWSAARKAAKKYIRNNPELFSDDVVQEALARGESDGE